MILRSSSYCAIFQTVSFRPYFWVSKSGSHLEWRQNLVCIHRSCYVYWGFGTHTEVLVCVQKSWYIYRGLVMWTDVLLREQRSWYVYRYLSISADDLVLVWAQRTWYVYRWLGKCTEDLVCVQRTWYAYRGLGYCTYALLVESFPFTPCSWRNGCLILTKDMPFDAWDYF